VFCGSVGMICIAWMKCHKISIQSLPGMYPRYIAITNPWLVINERGEIVTSLMNIHSSSRATNKNSIPVCWTDYKKWTFCIYLKFEFFCCLLYNSLSKIELFSEKNVARWLSDVLHPNFSVTGTGISFQNSLRQWKTKLLILFHDLERQKNNGPMGSHWSKQW
jgi:hypothetical protein